MSDTGFPACDPALTGWKACVTFSAAALAEKQELSAEEAAEMSRLWRKPVKLFHPDRCAHEREKQETYHKLTAAIHHAKDHGDLTTRRSACWGCRRRSV